MKIPPQPKMKFLGKFGATIAGAVHMTGDTAWEMHPHGEECLHLLSGAIDVIAEGMRDGSVTELRAGSACVVPRGRWHRLVVREAGDLLFITPTLGIQHRDVAGADHAHASKNPDGDGRAGSPNKRMQPTARRARRS